MHPEILSLSLFMFVTSCSPGPNNVVASHSGFNHGVKKSVPLMMGVIFGFTTMLAIVNFGLINIFNIYPNNSKNFDWNRNFFFDLSCLQDFVFKIS